METEKQQLTQKFIEILPFEGWNEATLEHACRELGFEKNYSKVLYPAGIDEFTREFSRISNNEALNKAAEIISANNLKVPEKAEEIIFQKIKNYHEKLKSTEALKKFIACCISPSLIVTAGQGVFEFSSNAWYLIGDKSTDFSYYTRRASFGAIYTKSLVYSLDDNSENLAKTRNYIKKSIDGLMKFHKLKGQVKGFVSKLPFKLKMKK